MNRDMQLIRELILYLENAEAGTELEDIQIEADDATLDYHLQLMEEAGLLELMARTRKGPIFKKLTWAGHDFADAARSDVVWKRAWKRIRETTQSASFDVLLSLLKGLLNKELLGD